MKNNPNIEEGEKLVKYTQTELDAQVEEYINYIEKLKKENKDLWDKIHEGPDPTIQVEDIPGEPPCSELLKAAQENALELARTFEAKLKLREEALDVHVARITELEKVEGLNLSQAECIRRLEQEIIDREGHPKIIDQLKKELARYQEEGLKLERKYNQLRTDLQDILSK